MFFYGCQSGANFCRMMCIIIIEKDIITFMPAFKTTFNSGKLLDSAACGFHVATEKMSCNKSCTGVEYHMQSDLADMETSQGSAAIANGKGGFFTFFYLLYSVICSCMRSVCHKGPVYIWNKMSCMLVVMAQKNDTVFRDTVGVFGKSPFHII